MRYITIIVNGDGVEHVAGQLPTDDQRSAAQLLAALQGTPASLPGTPAAPPQAATATRAGRLASARGLLVGDVVGLNRVFAPTTAEQEDVNAFFRANEADKPAKWAGLVEKQDRRRGD